VVVGAATVPDDLFHQLKLRDAEDPLHGVNHPHVLAAGLVVVNQHAVVLKSADAPLQEFNLLILVNVFGKAVGVASDAAVALGVVAATLAVPVNAGRFAADVVGRRGEDQISLAP
jgi:hypothetical protein